MKRKAVSLTLSLSLLMSMAALHVIDLAVVNGQVPHLFPDPLAVSIDNLNSSKVYEPYSEIVLTFNVSKDIGAASYHDLYPSEEWFRYSLDDNENVTGEPKKVSRSVSVVTSHHGGPTEIETTRYRVTINLLEASDGQHKITVYIGLGFFLPMAHGDYLAGWSYHAQTPLYFNVDTGCPIIQVTSPENLIYDNFDVPLNFTVNEVVSQISYSLDGCENVTITGNTTLTDLPYGGHNIAVYATDTVGNIGASETIFFKIANPSETMLAIASLGAVSIVGVGLLVYFKKRKQQIEQK